MRQQSLRQLHRAEIIHCESPFATIRSQGIIPENGARIVQQAGNLQVPQAGDKVPDTVRGGHIQGLYTKFGIRHLIQDLVSSPAATIHVAAGQNHGIPPGSKALNHLAANTPARPGHNEPSGGNYILSLNLSHIICSNGAGRNFIIGGR